MTTGSKNYLLLSAGFACGALWREDAPLNQLSIGQWGELVLTSLGAPLLGFAMLLVLAFPLLIMGELLGLVPSRIKEDDPLPPQ